MTITVFNWYFLRIAVLKDWTYVQYVDKFCDLGTFKVLLQNTEENQMFLDNKKTYFLSFGGEAMGIVNYANKDSDAEYDNTIELQGQLLNYITDKRVIYKQQLFNGKSSDIAIAATKKCFNGIYLSDKRAIKFIYSNVTDSSKLSNVKVQQTGGTLFEFIQPLLEQDELGFEILPHIDVDHEISAQSPLMNVSEWYFNILQGVDRTSGDGAVMFAHSLSNITRSTYTMESEDRCNVAYIAGEGEGNNRVWLEVYQPDISDAEKDDLYNIGWLRNECFIDARDLQKKTTDKTYTDAEYNDLLKQRAEQKLTEHITCVSYESTITNQGKRYTYGKGKDFYKGDYVIVNDNELGLSIKAQVTEVTKTIKDTGEEVLDIGLGYKKMTVNKKLKRKGVI